VVPAAPDHSVAREEFTNIRISRDRSSGASRWFTGPKEIVNEKVISYFKQHLFRDAKGIYIYQEFRQFSEKGYITVEGPLLEVFRVDAEKITFDNLDEVPTAVVEVVLNSDDEAPYVYYPRLQCYAAVGAGVSSSFSEFLTEAVDGFLFHGKPVPVTKISHWG
jgi:hypothetical protein